MQVTPILSKRKPRKPTRKSPIIRENGQPELTRGFLLRLQQAPQWSGFVILRNGLIVVFRNRGLLAFQRLNFVSQARGGFVILLFDGRPKLTAEFD